MIAASVFCRFSSQTELRDRKILTIHSERFNAHEGVNFSAYVVR